MSFLRQRVVVGRVLVVALASIVFTACSSQEQYRRALRDNDNLRRVLDDQSGSIDELRRQNTKLAAELESALGNALSPEFRQRHERALALLDELKGAGGAPDNVRIVERAEGVAFQIQGKVLFASGRAEVTDQGRDTLRPLIERLVSSGRRLRVEGHTDSDPIVNSSWGTNLRLSVERGVAVADLLIELGVPQERVSVAGYGQFSPDDPTDSDAAKARNRRVEILVLNNG